VIDSSAFGMNSRQRSILFGDLVYDKVASCRSIAAAVDNMTATFTSYSL
jgi:hypothetical protein